MSRYYCTKCNSTIEPGDKVSWMFAYKKDNKCPNCEELDLYELPGYETPKQYEMRTGKKWPDNGAIWFKHRDGKPFFDGGIWGVCRYVTAKETGDKVIICAQSPEPPPDDWKPEEVV